VLQVCCRCVAVIMAVAKRRAGCNVLLCVVMCYSELQLCGCVTVQYSVLQCVTMCYSVLQCVVSCRVLQRVTAYQVLQVCCRCVAV
jgi:hypothetical protein